MQGASEIHIEPYGLTQDSEDRIRIDGKCHRGLRIPKHNVMSLIIPLKVMTDQDISVNQTGGDQ